MGQIYKGGSKVIKTKHLIFNVFFAEDKKSYERYAGISVPFRFLKLAWALTVVRQRAGWRRKVGN